MRGHTSWIGIGLTALVWDAKVTNEIMIVPTSDAKTMVRGLAAEEAFIADISLSANAAATLREAKRLDSEATMVTLIIESGLKYHSGELWQDR